MDLMLELARRARFIVVGGLLAGALAVGASYLIKPTFTSSTLVLPPQQQQSLAASALSSLGALAGLAGGAGGIKSPLDQYVALLQSTTVADHMIERFKLREVYDEKLLIDARAVFWKRLRVAAGRRDGLITIEVDDHDPQRAADMARAMVDEFRRMTTALAITEAQQRKLFFEGQLKAAKDKLTAAQVALQNSGISPGAIKAEPKAAAEGYAKLRAEATAAEVKLRVLLGSMTSQSPEVQQQQAALAALKAQLAKVESSGDVGGDADYIGKYREFKYNETLFELFAKQYELARVDESREGGLIQVVDEAQVPEKKAKPKRAYIGVGVAFGVSLLLCVVVALRFQARRDPEGGAAKLGRLWSALLGRG
ncbi:MAG: lipopolysaccharide biosynthesis protein [Pelomonas sp.]|nr:lipopolysaccharide biosynthesis protein [Roseateles sp.]